jgi:hypothetical protein
MSTTITTDFEANVWPEQTFALVRCNNLLIDGKNVEIKIEKNEIECNADKITVGQYLVTLGSIAKLPCIIEHKKILELVEDKIDEINTKLKLVAKRNHARERLREILMKIDPTVCEISLNLDSTDYWMYSPLQFGGSFTLITVKYTNGDKLHIDMNRSFRASVYVNNKILPQSSSSVFVDKRLYNIIRAVHTVGQTPFSHREMFSALLSVNVVDKLSGNEMRKALVEHYTKRVAKLTDDKQLLEEYSKNVRVEPIAEMVEVEEE